MKFNNEKVDNVLPNIIGHSSNGGCFDGIDFLERPIFHEPFNFVDEKEKIAYGSKCYWECSYDNEGNCTITKKLSKVLK